MIVIAVDISLFELADSVMLSDVWQYVQELFEKEIASQENAQFSVCQAEKTAAKIAALENQQDIKVMEHCGYINKCYDAKALCIGVPF